MTNTERFKVGKAVTNEESVAFVGQPNSLEKGLEAWPPILDPSSIAPFHALLHKSPTYPIHLLNLALSCRLSRSDPAFSGPSSHPHVFIILSSTHLIPTPLVSLFQRAISVLLSQLHLSPTTPHHHPLSVCLLSWQLCAGVWWAYLHQGQINIIPLHTRARKMHLALLADTMAQRREDLALLRYVCMCVVSVCLICWESRWTLGLLLHRCSESLRGFCQFNSSFSKSP